MKKNILLLVIIALFSFPVFSQEIKLEQLTFPKGFHVNIFASDIKNARQMTLGDKGTIFVGTTNKNVYAITQNNGKTKINIIVTNLNQPQGVAFYKGDLYIAEINRIIRYVDIENHLRHLPKPTLISNLPFRQDEKGDQVIRHAWKTINFGPDGKLYVPIAMPCDTCLPENKYEGTIVRMNADGSEKEIFAKGLRNSVGFAWQPISNKLWFTDNGRDNLGDDFPPDKLCYAPVKGLDFGFPYYLGFDKRKRPIPDPKYGKLRLSTHGITWESFNLPAHVAPLNMIFYTGDMFPAKFKNQILIAEHGSWNRSKKVGYRITLVRVSHEKVLSYTPFITGWKKNEKYWGRPVGLLMLHDGSLLISDDYAHMIYRVTYEAS